MSELVEDKRKKGRPMRTEVVKSTDSSTGNDKARVFQVEPINRVPVAVKTQIVMVIKCRKRCL